MAKKNSVSKVEVSSGGRTITLSAEQFERAASPASQEPVSEYASKLRHVISGKLLNAVIKCFASRPYKGETTIDSSIGVAPESFVATNGHSAIIIGKRSDEYDATQRNEALVEAQRAIIYDKAVELDDIARFVDAKGDIEAYHAKVGDVVSQLDNFRSVGHMRPEVLKVIAAVADAAGAASVELLEPRESDSDRLGFRFSFEPEALQYEIGEEPVELPIKAEGIVVVTRKFRDDAEPEIEEAQE